ncbi:Octicosapeptide/Phox/Bem1p protein [Thalictrum thalictroides]|uniref:Octicosapeptide/Phox/Bem1p protein n=1 Tax=Thalictrum thalictroides TaxID=46969 RepID=A0A7J6X2M6_THATH|nr:Octicosapeptide/Phox/Bem1p protein [Thalictrum thalictroides]
MVTSLESNSPKSLNTIKFLCSYGGKILPRYPDGKLRYVGGETRVLAVDRSISFAELLVKMRELYGSSVTLRCQLPEEDLDALISITSDEDLGNVIEEYDLASQVTGSSLKIRAFLWPPKSIKKVSPTTSTSSLVFNPSPPRSVAATAGSRNDRIIRPIPTPIGYPVFFDKSSRTKPLCYFTGVPQATPKHSRLVHNGNHWQ